MGEREKQQYEGGAIIMSEPILEIKHLSKSFGSHEVLKDIDFEVRFAGVPDFKELKKIANEWLEQLNAVVEIK